LRKKLRHWQSPECQREVVTAHLATAADDVLFVEDGEALAPVLAHRFDQRKCGAGRELAPDGNASRVLLPHGEIGHQIDAEQTAAFEGGRSRRERGLEIAVVQE